MFQSIFLTLSLLGVITTGLPDVDVSNARLLATRSISLENRYADEWVNGVFKDNILLTMAYMRGEVKDANTIDWNRVRQPFTYEMKLKPNEVFAYHDDVMAMYKGRVAKTTEAHFNSYEGFKSDGWLVGDGVCHLASVINWAARDAKLDVVSPTRHDFAVIPDVPREYGVSIYSNPYAPGTNTNQNLYITNSLENTVRFIFEYKNSVLKVSVYEETPIE